MDVVDVFPRALCDQKIDLESFSAGVVYERVRQELRALTRFTRIGRVELQTSVPQSMIPLVSQLGNDEAWKLDFVESEVDELDLYSVVVQSW